MKHPQRQFVAVDRSNGKTERTVCNSNVALHEVASWAHASSRRDHLRKRRAGTLHLMEEHVDFPGAASTLERKPNDDHTISARAWNEFTLRTLRRVSTWEQWTYASWHAGALMSCSHCRSDMSLGSAWENRSGAPFPNTKAKHITDSNTKRPGRIVSVVSLPSRKRLRCHDSRHRSNPLRRRPSHGGRFRNAMHLFVLAK